MTEYERSGLVFTKTRVYKFGHRTVLTLALAAALPTRLEHIHWLRLELRRVHQNSVVCGTAQLVMPRHVVWQAQFKYRLSTERKAMRNQERTLSDRMYECLCELLVFYDKSIITNGNATQSLKNC
jgi:hypothetical protein